MKKIIPLSEKGRNRLYLTLDCETATLPFANEIAKSAEQKKKIAIAKPLIYDIGWTIHDSQNRLYARHSYLVTEIFSVPQVFNTAYYKDKRPIYLERLRKGETSLKPWSEVTEILFNDLQYIDYACAFNAMFDFKKAIPFTENYIYHLYNDDYQDWEDNQRRICQKIVNNETRDNPREFDSKNFNFKGIDFPIIDIWGVACDSLINNNRYKKSCLDNEMITESGTFFKTSAESVFRYLLNDYDFDEAHTAIEDVEIESIILCKALKKGAVEKGIIYFPFKILGETFDYLMSEPKGIKEYHFKIVINTMQNKLNSYETSSGFASKLQEKIWTLENLMQEKF